jgi:tetratricopeptide (TPR) repeat protein
MNTQFGARQGRAMVVMVIAISLLFNDGAVAQKPPAESTRVQLEQKIRLTSTLLSDSPTALRITRSGNQQAVTHLDEGRVHHALAEDLLARSDLDGARRAVDNALHHLGMARRLVPDASARQAAALQRHTQYLDSIERLIEAWRNRVGAQSPNDTTDITAAIGLVGTARQLAQNGRYEEANQTLARAEGVVLTGLNRALQAGTLDYTLRPSSPQEEFQHELARYRGFSELVPLAMHELKPRSDALTRIERYNQTSNALQAQALAQFQQGNTRQALVHIRNATLYAQRALQAAGLVTPPVTGSSP